MNDDNHELGERVDSLARKVDRLCRRFEEAWTSNERPRIEDFLPSVDSSERLIYLRALIEADIVQRVRIGERVGSEAYRMHFVTDSIAFNSLFDQSSLLRGSTTRGAADKVQTHSAKIRHMNDQVVQEMSYEFPDFEILKLIGWGGMGQVVKARDRVTGIEYALKTIRSDFLGDTKRLEWFRREIEIVKRIEHSNIPRALRAIAIDLRPVIATDYVNGIDLSRYVRDYCYKKNKIVPCELACDFVRQGAEALAYAHREGIIHRDVKPSNFVLDRKGKVWLVDFGLAGAYKRVPKSDGLQKYLMGTPDFIAPEQVDNFHLTDGRSDTYSLGCTFYFILSGQAPFAGGSIESKIYNHQHSTPQAIGTLRGEIPGDVIDILQKMTMKNPDDRFQDAMEIAAALRPYCPRKKDMTQPPHLGANLEEAFEPAMQSEETRDEDLRPLDLLIGGIPPQQRAYTNAGRTERKDGASCQVRLPRMSVGLMVRLVYFVAYTLMFCLTVFFVRDRYFSPKESTRSMGSGIIELPEISVVNTPPRPRSNTVPGPKLDQLNEQKFQARARLPIPDDSMGMIIPLYIYPIAMNNARWDQVLALGNRGVRITTVIGPNLDVILAGDKEAYRALIIKANDRHIKVLGKVSFRAKKVTARQQIDLYHDEHNGDLLDGLLFTEFPDAKSPAPDYAELYQHARELNRNWKIVSGPEGPINEKYFTEAKPDILCRMGSTVPQPQVWEGKYPPDRFAAIINNVVDARVIPNYLEQAVARNLGWIYIGGKDVHVDPPSYLNWELAAIAKMNQQILFPPTSVGRGAAKKDVTKKAPAKNGTSRKNP